MVESMKPGSVLIDLAVERGGNVEAREPGETVAPSTASRSSASQPAGPPRRDASALYARTSSPSSRRCRQGDEGACRQMGRRDRQGDLPDARRRRRPSGLPAATAPASCLTDGSPSCRPLTPEQAIEQSRAGGRAPRRPRRIPRRRSPTRSPTAWPPTVTHGARSIRPSFASRSSCWRSSSATTWSGR